MKKKKQQTLTNKHIFRTFSSLTLNLTLAKLCSARAHAFEPLSIGCFYSCAFFFLFSSSLNFNPCDWRCGCYCCRSKLPSHKKIFMVNKGHVYNHVSMLRCSIKWFSLSHSGKSMVLTLWAVSEWVRILIYIYLSAVLLYIIFECEPRGNFSQLERDLSHCLWTSSFRWTLA